MKERILTFFIIFFSASLFSSTAAQLKTNEVVIYSNSFESQQDTMGWHVGADVQFCLDAPPGGGEQSIYVSGACIVPHFWIELGPFDGEGLFRLRCWGKNLGMGGEVTIEVESEYPRPSAPIFIDKKDWTFYESKDTLNCPAGKKIILSMISGGLIPSSMLVDLVEIIRVDFPTSLNELTNELTPGEFCLYQNYPNPFNPVTKIKYSIPAVETGHAPSLQQVKLKIYDLLGREIATLVNEEKAPGEYEVEFSTGSIGDGSNLTSGIYFYVLSVRTQSWKAGGKTLSKKMCLIK